VTKHKPPYLPEGKQKELYDIDTRFVIACVGRQWGKGFVTMLKVIKRSQKGGVYWWVEPIIPQAKVHFRRMLKHFKHIIAKVNRSELSVQLVTGTVWYFKGCEKPENLDGETLDGLVLDEAAKAHEDVWFQTLLPMLAVKKGFAYLIGKPRGNNYFKRLFKKAELKENKDWTAYHTISKTSPFFSLEEWDRAKEDTPELIFRQEYLAEFIDDAGTVFRDISKSVKGKLGPYYNGLKYFAGIDLARTVDYTVICILNSRCELVAFERFNNIAWSLQKERIIKLCKAYDAQCLVDSTGIGDPIFDDLAMAGLKISGYKFTNQSKRALIENLVLTFERGDIILADIPVLIDELNNFEVEQTTSGLIRYNAADGQHDDTVIALALANYFCVSIKGGWITTIGERETAKAH